MESLDSSLALPWETQRITGEVIVFFQFLQSPMGCLWWSSSALFLSLRQMLFSAVSYISLISHSFLHSLMSLLLLYSFTYYIVCVLISHDYETMNSRIILSGDLGWSLIVQHLSPWSNSSGPRDLSLLSKVQSLE